MRLAKLCLLASFALLVLVACGKQKPEDVAARFVEASYKGDAGAAIALIDFDAKSSRPGEAEIITGKVKAAVAQQKERADARGGLDKVTTEPAQAHPGDAKRASVNVTAHFKQGTVDNDRVQLVQTDQGWRVKVF